MPDPETQTALPEPGPAPDLPSVNPEAHPAADSESQTTNWVDPLFLERDSSPLPDEIVEAGSEEVAQAIAAENEDAGPSAEQLANLVAHFNESPDSDDTAEKPAPDGDKADKPVHPAAKVQEDPATSGDACSDSGSKAAADGEASM